MPGHNTVYEFVDAKIENKLGREDSRHSGIRQQGNLIANVAVTLGLAQLTAVRLITGQLEWDFAFVLSVIASFCLAVSVWFSMRAGAWPSKIAFVSTSALKRYFVAATSHNVTLDDVSKNHSLAMLKVLKSKREANATDDVRLRRVQIFFALGSLIVMIAIGVAVPTYSA